VIDLDLRELDLAESFIEWIDHSLRKEFQRSSLSSKRSLPEYARLGETPVSWRNGDSESGAKTGADNELSPRSCTDKVHGRTANDDVAHECARASARPIPLGDVGRCGARLHEVARALNFGPGSQSVSGRRAGGGGGGGRTK